MNRSSNLVKQLYLVVKITTKFPECVKSCFANGFPHRRENLPCIVVHPVRRLLISYTAQREKRALALTVTKCDSGKLHSLTRV